MYFPTNPLGFYWRVVSRSQTAIFFLLYRPSTKEKIVVWLRKTNWRAFIVTKNFDTGKSVASNQNNHVEGPATKKIRVRDLRFLEIYRFIKALKHGDLRYFNGDVWYQKNLH